MRRRSPSTTQTRGLLSHRLHSQMALHQAYGGVVPELASRDHVRRLLPLVREALAEARLGSSFHRRDRLYRRPRSDWRPAGRRGVRHRPRRWHGAGLRSVSIIWRVTFSRRCSSSDPRPFPSSPCSSPAATPSSWRSRALGRYRILGRDAGRCRRRGLRQDRQTSGAALPGRGRARPRSRSAAVPVNSSSRGPCWTGRGWTSVSVA